MKNRVEIDCPNAWNTYNKKGVLFIRDEGGRMIPTEGKFIAAPNSKEMWLTWVVEANQFKRIVERIPITQEMLQGIAPASQALLDDSNGGIAYQIQIPIKPVRNKKHSPS